MSAFVNVAAIALAGAGLAAAQAPEAAPGDVRLCRFFLR